jgi:sulfur carrier protein ThiS
METVCIVEDYKYKYFKDYLLSLGIPIRLYPCQINPGERVFVVQSLLSLNYENASYVALINTEQLTRSEWQQHIINTIEIKPDLHLFDYSKSNIKHFELVTGKKMEHLPYKYREEEISQLKQLIKDTPKEYDIAFVGSINQRRIDIIQTLRDRNVTVNMIDNLWDIDRDIEIAKCKILLNLHYTEEYNIFEEIRCNRWLMSDLTVITENSLYENEISYKNNLIIVERDKIIGTLLNYFCK